MLYYSTHLLQFQFLSVHLSDLLVVPKESLSGQDTLNTYFIDVAPAVRNVVGKRIPIRELATRILQMVISQYKKVFLVCVTYQQNSINAGEREARGARNRYFLASPDMKMPYDFADMIFIEMGVTKKCCSILSSKRLSMVIHLFKAEPLFSDKRDCMMINEDQAFLVPSLSCNHEEADINLFALDSLCC